MGSRATTPAFMDLDGDGDQDIIMGGGDGSLHQFMNTGSPSDPHFEQWPLGTSSGSLVEVLSLGAWPSNESFPAFADVNGDGSADVIIATNKPSLSVVTNVGSTSTPIALPSGMPSLTSPHEPSNETDAGGKPSTKEGIRFQLLLGLTPGEFVSGRGRKQMLALFPGWLNNHLSLSEVGITTTIVSMSAVSSNFSESSPGGNEAGLSHALAQGFSTLSEFCQTASGGTSAYCVRARRGRRASEAAD